MDEVKNQLQKLLNRHGYGFQYSVLKRAQELVGEKKSRWVFEVAEFPAGVQEPGTRIDFILNLTGTRLFILAECKRVNPKLGSWCFVKARYVRRNQNAEYFTVDHVECRKGVFPPYMVTEKHLMSIPDDRVYHIGLAVKTDQKGESGNSDRKAIEEAATQICRGSNGLIDSLSQETQLVKTEMQDHLIYAGATFIPVIFTTAEIYTCECDLSSADIETGNVDLSGLEVSKRDWIYYQYHLSPGIKHSIELIRKYDKFADALHYHYVRTICVVAATGIDSFLQYMRLDNLGT